MMDFSQYNYSRSPITCFQYQYQYRSKSKSTDNGWRTTPRAQSRALLALVAGERYFGEGIPLSHSITQDVFRHFYWHQIRAGRYTGSYWESKRSCLYSTATRDTASTPKRPAILWIHGGGMVLGTHIMDLSMMRVWVQELGAVIVSVDYRLAPEHKAPAAVDDTFAGWEWMISNAADLGIDTSRLVVAGNSAGGGLAATTVQRIHDTESPIQPILQLLVYPMLDDRTVLRFNGSIKAHVWTPKANRYGWTSFLGCKPGSTDVPPYSVAARRQDLTGLPPMWIGVGTLDMFHDEDVAYARRLRTAVPMSSCSSQPERSTALMDCFPILRLQLLFSRLK